MARSSGARRSALSGGGVTVLGMGSGEGFAVSSDMGSMYGTTRGHGYNIASSGVRRPRSYAGRGASNASRA